MHTELQQETMAYPESFEKVKEEVLSFLEPSEREMFLKKYIWYMIR